MGVGFHVSALFLNKKRGLTEGCETDFLCTLCVAVSWNETRLSLPPKCGDYLETGGW